jgi:DNA-binding NarL/FixJ family response regulator
MKQRKISAPRKMAKAPRTWRKQIMLVDDHPMTRAGVADLINKQSDMQVCAEFGDPSEAFGSLAKQKPDLLVADISMPGRGGIEFLKDILALRPDLAILVLSMHDERIYAERALRTGARGYIMKDQGGEKLLAAIRHVLGGGVYVSDQISAAILDHLADRRPRGSNSPIAILSDREFEIFCLIGEGKSSREVAEQLHLSSKTVDTHRTRIKEKLEIKDAVGLVCHAVRWVEAEGSAFRSGGRRAV